MGNTCLRYSGIGKGNIVYFRPSPNLPNVIVIEPDIFEDSRGFFLEMYHHKKFEESGIKENFIQDNRSQSRRGTLRGLHYQIEKSQGNQHKDIEIQGVAAQQEEDQAQEGHAFAEGEGDNSRLGQVVQ